MGLLAMSVNYWYPGFNSNFPEKFILDLKTMLLVTK